MTINKAILFYAGLSALEERKVRFIFELPIYFLYIKHEKVRNGGGYITDNV